MQRRGRWPRKKNRYFHWIFRQASELSEAAPAMRRIMTNSRPCLILSDQNIFSRSVRIFSWSGACDASADDKFAPFRVSSAASESLDAANVRGPTVTWPP